MTEQVKFNVIQQPNAYEGASTSYKNGVKGLLNGSVDDLAEREIANLRMRTDHAIRNNGYAETAITKYVTSLNAVKVNWITSKKRKHKKMQKLWEQFIKDPNLDGYGDFKVTQSLVHFSMFRSGASFIRMLIKRTGNDNIVPLKLQPIPTEMHDIFYRGKTAEDNIRHGIRFNDTKPTEYFFRKGIHSSLFHGTSNVLEVQGIPAEDIVHSFIRESPGQWIGIPFLASILIPLYEIDELIESTVAKQKSAQAIARGG